MMNTSRRRALRQCHPDLRTCIRVNDLLPRLHVYAGGFLNDVENARVKGKEIIEKVDELIDILVNKENRDFDYFCIVLEKEGYAKDANKLRELAGIECPRRSYSAPVYVNSSQSPWNRDQVHHEVLPQSPLPSSLRNKVHNVELPNMPMGAVSYAATVHNSKVYIRASKDERGTRISPILVYSTNEYKWSTLPQQRSSAAIAVVNNHVTLIGGQDILTNWYTNTPSTWYEEEGRWKQVLPPMPTGRVRPAVISHDNLLLVTGGLAEDGSTVLNTTDVLDLTTMAWRTPEGLDLPIPLWHHNLVLCGEYLYLVGGNIVCPVKSPEDGNSWSWRAKWSDVKQIAASQHSQPQNGIWTQIADPRTLFPTAFSCGETLYTVGGLTRDDRTVSTVYSYIPAGNQWVSVGDMSVGRYDHCAVPLNSTVIFVAGGRVINNGKAFFSPLAELLVL